MTETAHCYQEKNEKTKTIFCVIQYSFNTQTLRFSVLLWKLKREQKVGKISHLCAKSSCCNKVHWFYTPVSDQMLSLFFKWSCFYGWCSAVDICILRAYTSSVSRLVFIMSNYINSFYDQSSQDLKNCVLILPMPGHLPVLLTNSVPGISKRFWNLWASNFLSIKRRKLMEGHDLYLHQRLLWYDMRTWGVMEGGLNWKSDLKHLNSTDIYFIPIVYQILKVLTAVIL